MVRWSRGTNTSQRRTKVVYEMFSYPFLLFSSRYCYSFMDLFFHFFIVLLVSSFYYYTDSLGSHFNLFVNLS